MLQERNAEAWCLSYCAFTSKLSCLRRPWHAFNFVFGVLISGLEIVDGVICRK